MTAWESHLVGWMGMTERPASMIKESPLSVKEKRPAPLHLVVWRHSGEPGSPEVDGASYALPFGNGPVLPRRAVFALPHRVCWGPNCGCVVNRGPILRTLAGGRYDLPESRYLFDPSPGHAVGKNSCGQFECAPRPYCFVSSPVRPWARRCRHSRRMPRLSFSIIVLFAIVTGR